MDIVKNLPLQNIELNKSFALKEIEQSDGKDVYDMFQEIPKVELGSENIANGMTEEEFEEYKKKLIDNAKGLNLNPIINNQKVNYILYRDNYPVGSIALRLKLNKYGEEHYGHIGYSIRPSERGKGYGTIMLKLVLDKAREYGLKEVILLCGKDNVASQRTIKKNGGVKYKEADDLFYRIKLDN